MPVVVVGFPGNNLPVSLLDFKGNLNSGTVKLNWTVVNEINMSHYIVERSVDGATFSQVGKVNATGNSTNTTTYTLADDVSRITNSTIYYRLKQVDKNGATKMSNVLVFKLSNKANSLVINPNPANSFFVLKVTAAKEGIATIKITDMYGKVILTQSHKLSAGSNAITFNDLNRLASGTYNVQVLVDGEILNTKLVVLK